MDIGELCMRIKCIVSSLMCFVFVRGNLFFFSLFFFFNKFHVSLVFFSSIRFNLRDCEYFFSSFPTIYMYKYLTLFNSYNQKCIGQNQLYRFVKQSKNIY
jgi:hypothetical protein